MSMRQNEVVCVWVCACVCGWVCVSKAGTVPPGLAGSLSVQLIRSEWQRVAWLHRGQMTSDTPRLVL